MVEYIEKCTKEQQFAIMKAIKPFVTISQVEISRQTNMSSSLVAAVFAGVNNNPVVLKIIFLNLKDGWEDSLPSFAKQKI
jgi:hypothetical protein